MALFFLCLVYFSVFHIYFYQLVKAGLSPFQKVSITDSYFNWYKLVRTLRILSAVWNPNHPPKQTPLECAFQRQMGPVTKLAGKIHQLDHSKASSIGILIIQWLDICIHGGLYTFSQTLINKNPYELKIQGGLYWRFIPFKVEQKLTNIFIHLGN